MTDQQINILEGWTEEQLHQFASHVSDCGLLKEGEIIPSDIAQDAIDYVNSKDINKAYDRAMKIL